MGFMSSGIESEKNNLDLCYLKKVIKYRKNEEPWLRSHGDVLFRQRRRSAPKKLAQMCAVKSEYRYPGTTGGVPAGPCLLGSGNTRHDFGSSIEAVRLFCFHQRHCGNGPLGP